MKTALLILLLLVIIGCSAGYILRAKRRGDKCIGCPYAKNCNGNCK